MEPENCLKRKASQHLAHGREQRFSQVRESLFLSSGYFLFETGCDDRMKERHHGAKLWPELFELRILFALPCGEEIRAARFILCNPFFRKAAIANFFKDLLHF